MYNNKLTPLHICLICLALTSCEAGNPKRHDTAAQLQARTQMLAENDQTIAKAKSSVFPTGNKKLLEPDMLAVQAVPCDGNFFLLNELTVRNFGLSNRDVSSAVMLLETMGYNTISHASVDAGSNGRFVPSAGVGKYSCDDLPLVLVPRPHEESNLVLGNNSPAFQGNNQSGSAQTGVGNLAISPLRRANAVDLDQLIVFYHESQTVKIERFEVLLDSIVDIASPQVYIETMVL